MKKFGLNPLFIVLGIFCCIMGFAKFFFIYLFVVILHELAHLLVAQKLGYKLNKIFLMPYGASLSLQQNFFDEKDEIIIASAGPLTNFVLVIFCIALWWLYPISYNFLQEFVWANIITGLINILPCYPLDGGRILVSLLTLKNKNRKQSLKICFYFNYFFVFILFIMFIFNIFEYFSFLIMALFIFLGTFENRLNGQFNIINIPFISSNNTLRKITNVNILAVPSEMEIYKIAKYLKKNYYNLIYLYFKNGNIKILNEYHLEQIFLKNKLNYSFNDLISNN